MATSTERSRRRRAHQRDDHSRCLPENCPHAPRARLRHDGATVITHREAAQLLDDLDVNSLPPAAQLVAIQAAETVDRIALVKRLMDDGDIDALRGLAELRGQASTLKGLVAELRAWRPEVQAEEAPDALDELARARAARLAAAAGR